MQGLLSLARMIDRMSDVVGRIISYVAGLMVAVVFADVVMRYLFTTSFVVVQELEWWLFSIVFLIGAGYTLRHDGHVRVDIIYQRLSTRTQAWINLLGCLLFLFPGCWLIISTSIPFVQNSYAVMEGSPDPGGMPYYFLLKACIPFGFVLFAIQGVSMFIKSLATVMGHQVETEDEGKEA